MDSLMGRRWLSADVAWCDRMFLQYAPKPAWSNSKRVARPVARAMSAAVTEPDITGADEKTLSRAAWPMIETSVCVVNS
jgi:hypothetical protein